MKDLYKENLNADSQTLRQQLVENFKIIQVEDEQDDKKLDDARKRIVTLEGQEKNHEDRINYLEGQNRDKEKRIEYLEGQEKNHEDRINYLEGQNQDKEKRIERMERTLYGIIYINDQPEIPLDDSLTPQQIAAELNDTESVDDDHADVKVSDDNQQQVKTIELN